MRVQTTTKIKITATPEIVETLKIYQKGLQFCVNEAWTRKIKNAFKLQPFVYSHLRSLTLQSQLAIACIKQATGMVKKGKTKPIVNNVSMRYNFPRSASFKNNTLSLATIKGRQKFDFEIPECYKPYFEWDVKESLLRIDKKGRCFFLFTFAKEVSPNVLDSQSQILGIDLGIKNLAVCSDNRFFRVGKVKQIKRKYKFLRAKLQAKGTKSSKRLLKKISGKEQRFMADINHCTSKKIVAGIPSGKIIMENLKGIRKKNRGRKMNYWISNWSFYQLQFFIQYKAERKGLIFEKVKPNYTSQICHKCGLLGSRSGSLFSCHCGCSCDADLNAARNLASPKLVERQAAVNRPNVACCDAKASSDELKRSIVTSPRTLVVGY